MLIIEIKDDVSDASWLPQNPNYLSVVTAEGTILIYNLSDTIEKPVEVIPSQNTQLDHILSLSVSESQQSLVLISKMGVVSQFSLSSEIFDNRFMLDKTYTT